MTAPTPSPLGMNDSPCDLTTPHEPHLIDLMTRCPGVPDALAIDGTPAVLPPRLLGVNWHVMIHYTPKQLTHTGGVYANGVAIFAAPIEERHAYVVWTIFLVDDDASKIRDQWRAEQGDYCETMTDALEAYARRGGDLTQRLWCAS